MKAGDPGKVDRAREATTEFSLNEFKFLPKLRLGITTFNVKKCKIKKTLENFVCMKIIWFNINRVKYMQII